MARVRYVKRFDSRRGKNLPVYTDKTKTFLRVRRHVSKVPEADTLQTDTTKGDHLCDGLLGRAPIGVRPLRSRRGLMDDIEYHVCRAERPSEGAAVNHESKLIVTYGQPDVSREDRP